MFIIYFSKYDFCHRVEVQHVLIIYYQHNSKLFRDDPVGTHADFNLLDDVMNKYD